MDGMRLLLLIFFLMIWGCRKEQPDGQSSSASAKHPEQITVAAAADLKFALDELLVAFCAHHPDVQVTATYGSSGSLFVQISNGAPFDLFLSADMAYPQKLIEQGLAVYESAFRYANGHLVIWVRADSPLDPAALGMSALVEPSVRKVAIANPQHAPYGRAAVAAFESAGLYDSLRDRLVLGENVAQAAQFVESGAADVGVIALSLALSPAMRDKGRYWEIPQDRHPPIEPGGVILNRAKDSAGAQQLRAWIVGPGGRSILKRYGFFSPDE